MGTALADMVREWAWNDDPADARRQSLASGYPLAAVASEMRRQGYQERDVVAVTGTVCPNCGHHYVGAPTQREGAR